MYRGLAGRRGDLEDEHVLGQPALVPRHHRGDPQRVALLAEQRVPAVPRPVGPDLPGLGEVRDVLGRRCTATARPPARAPAARPPSARHRTNDPPSSIARSAARAHPGHDPHRDHHVRRVGDLHPELGDLAAQRAHAERHHVHGAAAHGTRRRSPRTSCASRSGAIQLLVGPASCSRSEQMNVRSSTRATSPGSEAHQKLFGRSSRVQPGEGPVLDEQAGQPVPFVVRAVTPDDLIGLGQLRDLADPLGQLRQARPGLDGVCAEHRYHSRAGLACAAHRGKDRAEQRRG